ncbi:MAG: YceI family protein [Bryobacteraceae bacterium]
MRLRILTMVAAALAPLFGQEATLHLNPATTQVEYTLGDVLHTVHGTFKLKSGHIRFDPSTGQASGSLIVDATSGNSGSGARDRRMNDAILESAQYPEIAFTPDRVDGKLNLRGDSEVSLHGTFRIHGADHEMVLPVKAHVAQSNLSAEIQFPVPYVKCGMRNPSTLFLRVKDTVRIQIHAVGQLSGVSF